MEIVHIPEKPPIQPDQQPTVDVLAAFIEPKLANTLIRRLNQIAPLEGLRHVKRVCKNKHLQTEFLEGKGQGEGKSELCVILCLASQDTNDSCSVSYALEELITCYHLTVFKTKVCKDAATSKEEWEEQCKLWPTSFHPPTYNIDGIKGFSSEDSQSIFSFMTLAIQLAKSVGGSIVNAAVIVDPSVNQVICSARDQTFSCGTPSDKNDTEINCCKQQEALNSNTNSEGRLSCKTPESNSFPDETKELYGGVSCLFPQGWAEQQPNSSSSHWHPLQHAAIVAIESSADRDRRLFPILGEIQDECTDKDSMQSDFVGSPVKKQKTNRKKVKGEEIIDGCSESSHCLTDRPYLCTGYDIYLVWEPCPMCAMALVHQRIKRIFFAFPNPNGGALGSVYRLQGERSLNHHYAVFRVIVPDSEQPPLNNHLLDSSLL